jgi:motility quorum-sensing regulator/GCU-specific mRNA interferase toxin
MEKLTPSYKLSDVKRHIAAGRVHATFSSIKSAALLGIDFQGMQDIIMALLPADFYKSMTTHANHRIWQDVYRPHTSFGDIYLKLTVINDVLIVSFKRR